MTNEQAIAKLNQVLTLANELKDYLPNYPCWMGRSKEEFANNIQEVVSNSSAALDGLVDLRNEIISLGVMEDDGN
jgi:hypothetical protein